VFYDNKEINHMPTNITELLEYTEKFTSLFLPEFIENMNLVTNYLLFAALILIPIIGAIFPFAIAKFVRRKIGSLADWTMLIVYAVSAMGGTIWYFTAPETAFGLQISRGTLACLVGYSMSIYMSVIWVLVYFVASAKNKLRV